MKHDFELLPQTPVCRPSGHRRHLLLSCLLVASFFGQAALAGEKIITRPKTRVVAAANQLFSGMDMKIDNYGGKKKSQWYRQESFMTLPTGQTIRFDVPRFHMVLATPVGRRYWHYFINDFGLDRTRLTAGEKGLKLVMDFESAGNEIKGKCTRRTFNGKDNCDYRGPRDIQVDNARAVVKLRPAAVNGRFGFAPIRPQDIHFSADIKLPDRLCRTLNALKWLSYASGGLAESIAIGQGQNYCQKMHQVMAKQMQQVVSSQLTAALNRPAIRKQMAAYMTEQLQLPVAKNQPVAKVTEKGSTYRIVLADTQGKKPGSHPPAAPPRAPGKPKTTPKPRPPVSIVSFEANPKVLIGQCPGKIEFSGRIRSLRKGTVEYYFVNNKGIRSGTYRLRFDQPGTKAVIPWSVGVDRPKKGMVISLKNDTGTKPASRFEVQGKQKLVVVTPQGKLSREAEYKVDCDKPKVMQLHRLPD